MATTTHESTTPTGSVLNIGRLSKPMLVAGVVLLAIYGALLFTNGSDSVYGSYLFGWTFWMSLTLGMFGMSLLHNTVRGTWTVSVVRLMEAGGSWQTIVIMGLLFAPILISPSHLYEWAMPSKAADHVIAHRAVWMNPTFFAIRTAFYIASWAWLANFLRKSVFRQEAGGGFKLEAGRSSWGAAGMVYFFVSVTLALTDWVMSMDSHWYSTMYGAWFIIMSTGAALAFCILVFNTNADKEPYRAVISKTLGKDLGNMMFTLTMLWGYTSLSQFLIIWNGNIPETTSYYKNRSSEMYPPGMEGNHWGILGLALMVGRFFVPFFGLLAPRMKKYAENMRLVGGWIFCMHIIEVYLLVQPSIPGRAAMGPWAPSHLGYDILAFLGFGALWLSIFSAQTTKAPLIPTYDHRLEAMKHAH